MQLRVVCGLGSEDRRLVGARERDEQAEARDGTEHVVVDGDRDLLVRAERGRGRPLLVEDADARAAEVRLVAVHLRLGEAALESVSVDDGGDRTARSADVPLDRLSRMAVVEHEVVEGLRVRLVLRRVVHTLSLASWGRITLSNRERVARPCP